MIAWTRGTRRAGWRRVRSSGILLRCKKPATERFWPSWVALSRKLNVSCRMKGHRVVSSSSDSEMRLAQKGRLVQSIYGASSKVKLLVNVYACFRPASVGTRRRFNVL